METSKAEEPVVLDRASRITRGKRMNKLLDEEVEQDDYFWNQDALKEEENDVNYEEEAEVADEFDSDFDEDEPEPDEEVENDADDRPRTKKRLSYPGKTLAKKKKKKSPFKLERVTKDEKTSPESTVPENNEVPDDLEVERIVRKSTRTSVIVRQAERDAIRAALQATMKNKQGEVVLITILCFLLTKLNPIPDSLSIVLGNVASWPLCMIMKDGSSVVLPVTITKGVGEEGVVFGGWSC
ncbi:SWR1 complex subunit 2 [Vitis vinifera]|uniref:SWR1 complex subunit 2 n=1 Tax=Vitis vinifera TaxID=29760 RepID=A0A438IYD0_VITVI|nr:SWR1 complex subunit 2 [Vitis vinifera]